MAIQQAYGRRLNTFEILLDSGTDGNLEDIILGYVPADPNLNILVTIQGVGCWGASSTLVYGMTTGNLSGWKSVQLEVEATAAITGKGGTGGFATTTVANPGNPGGGALEVTSDLRMSNESQARCFGGGGGGGSGGAGGGGSQWIQEGWIGDGWKDNGCGNTTSYINYPNGVRVYTGSGHTCQGGTPFYYGGKKFERGWNRTQNANIYTTPAIYECNRSYSQTGNPGDGGYGGRGAGPCIESLSAGGLGTNGTYDAGNGGDGGAGGDFRLKGEDGEDGTWGDYGPLYVGGIGGDPGDDIILNGGAVYGPVTFDGPDISVPELERGNLMAPIDVAPKYSGTIDTWEKIGAWPPGVDLTAAGVIQGTPTLNGLYSGLKVKASNPEYSALSNVFSILVTSSAVADGPFFDASSVPKFDSIQHKWDSY